MKLLFCTLMLLFHSFGAFCFVLKHGSVYDTQAPSALNYKPPSEDGAYFFASNPKDTIQEAGEESSDVTQRLTRDIEETDPSSILKNGSTKSDEQLWKVFGAASLDVVQPPSTTASRDKKNESDEDLWKAFGAASLDVSLLVLKGLRWGLVQTLTASLPSSQQKELLERLKEDDASNDEDEVSVRGSVAEEAVAAEMAVVSTQEFREELEKAAKARVEAELKVQQYRLEQESIKQNLEALETEKQKLEKQVQDLQKSLSTKQMERKEKSSVTDASIPHLSPKDYRALSLEQKIALKAEREAIRGQGDVAKEKSSSFSDHPLLGPVVADLGYKRIYCVSSGKLGTIPIWEKQRSYRNNRAKVMADEKEKSMHLGFPGIICLYEDHKGRLSILDGQHRVGMMQVLRARLNKQAADKNSSAVPYDQYEMLDNVLVEVYSEPQKSVANSTRRYGEQVFFEINKAEPVKLLDMPGVASSSDRKIISNAAEMLEKNFPSMFSTSQRCRVPNVNVDNFRNSLYGANLLRRHNFTTSKELFDWLIEVNASLGSKYEGQKERTRHLSSKAWKKASENGFYLGLENSWLYS